MIWAPVQNRYSDQSWTLDENASLWKDLVCAPWKGAGSQAIDVSGRGNHGTLTNVDRTCGFNRRAYVYNHSYDSFDVTRHSSLEPQKVSLSAWCRWTHWENSYRHQIIFAKDHASYADPYYSYHLRGDGLNDNIHFYVAPSSWSGASVASAAFTPVLGRWYHIFASYDDSASPKSIICVDGVQLASENTSVTIAYHDTPLRIGYSDIVGVGFRGDIADPLVFAANVRAWLPQLSSRRPDLDGAIRSSASLWIPSVSGSTPSTYTPMHYYQQQAAACG